MLLANTRVVLETALCLDLFPRRTFLDIGALLLKRREELGW